MTEQTTVEVQAYDAVADATSQLAAAGPAAAPAGALFALRARLPRDLRLQLLEQHEPLLIADTSVEPERWAAFRAGSPRHEAVRYFWSCPLVCQGEVVGFLNAHSARPVELEPERLDRLAGLARLLAGPLRLAQAAEQDRERADREALVDRVAQLVAEAHDLPELLRETAREVGLALGAPRVVVWMGETEAELRLAEQWTEPGAARLEPGLPLQAVAVPTALRAGRTVALADTRDDPRLEADGLGRREVYAASGITASLATPLAAGGRVLGVLALHELDGPRLWSGAEVQHLEAVAHELAVAVISIRQLQARQREAERLLALQRAAAGLAEQPQLEGVLAEVLQSAVSLLGADAGAIYRWNGETGRLDCQQRCGPHRDSLPSEVQAGAGAIGQAFSQREALIVAEERADALSSEPAPPPSLQALVAVPISFKGQPLGVLAVGSRGQGRGLSLEDRRLLEHFASQVAVAIENSQLYDDLEQRLARIKTLNRLNRLISSSLDLNDVLPEIARAATELTGATVASFWLVDHAAESLELRAFSDESLGADQAFRRARFGQGAAGWVALHRRPLISDDVFTDGQTGGLDWYRRHGLKTACTLPVCFGESLLAVLSLNGREPFRLADDQHELIESFLAQAALAIRNASLYGDLERAKADLERALHRLELILNTAAEGIFGVDAAGAVTFANPALAALTGYSVDELLGRNAHDLLHHTRPDGTPYPWEQCPARAVMAEGRALRASGEVYWRKDGSSFAIELTITPLHEQGRLVGAVNTLRDVTDRLRAEASLRESEERFRTLSMWSPIGIYQTDASGQTQYVNPRWQEISGLTLEESLGYGWTSRIHPDDREAVFAAWDRAVAARAEFSMEFRLLHPSGQTRWVHSRGVPVLAEGGELTGYAGAVEDLTERKSWEAEVAHALAVQRQANEQLERLNRAKSNFVSVVSHEFRTPLTGIQGFSELMRDGDFSLEEMKEFSADINREAERLGRMITDVLDLDRMESGRMSVHLEQVDLNALAAETAEHCGRTAPAHRLRVEPDPALPILTADRDKLTQVLVNLIANAIKYSPDGGDVTVATQRQGAEAHLSVRDQGIGLPPEALEAVFERYARVESGPHRYVKGTGLGLPIVREIARLHGGRVWAESEPGQGSTFHLVLPLAGPPTGE